MNLPPNRHATCDAPHLVYRESREHHSPYYCEPRDLCVVSRYADVLAVVKNPETRSSAQGVAPSRYPPDEHPFPSSGEVRVR